MRLTFGFACCLLVAAVYTSLQAQEKNKYWVYFTDKGESMPVSGKSQSHAQAYKQALEVLSPRALQRRAKVLPVESVIGTSDFPVFQAYVDKVKQVAGSIQQQSRWLNAVSVYLTIEQSRTLSTLQFVKSVTPVITFHGKKISNEALLQPYRLAKTTLLDYGESQAQIDMVNVIPLHAMGITGKEVRIGMLDSGFRWKTHESMKSRNVLAEYDFIFHDNVTANEERDSPTQDEHGTFTFSTLGGYKEGELIGPAFDAEFLLAKTEYIPSETQIEEDNWAAGIEWLEAQGADIISSSLGYDTFANDSNYTWEHGDFDGKTSVTAQAALRAARLGVLVCNAMGNEGKGDGIRGTMLTPADTDSILSVGAMTFTRRLAGFSSTGPTNDGRTKPDVVAVGSSVYCAAPEANSYVYVQGTSLSTPLAAGSAALVLSARPELTAIEVRDALRNTADTANFDVSNLSHHFPNNFWGWGAVNGFKAALSFGPIFSNKPEITSTGSLHTVITHVASKFGILPDSVVLYYKTGNDSPYYAIPMEFDSAMFFATSGRYKAVLPVIADNSPIQFYIEAKDSVGNTYQSPAPILHKQWQFCCGTNGVWSGAGVPTEAALLQNYPNPFNSTTTITFEMKRCEQAEVAIYSLTGQKVKSLYNALAVPEQYQIRWTGENEQGQSVASGVYFVRLETPTFTSTKSLLLLR